MKPESILRTKIANAMRAKGAFVRVTHGDGHTSGALDLDCCYKGRTVKIEVKTPQNPDGMTKLQLHEQKLVRAAGGVAEEVRSVDAALSLLVQLDRGDL